MLKYSGRILKSIIFKKPIFCTIKVTNRCNLRCRMCSVWRHSNKEKEMSLEQFRELSSILKKLNITIVNLGGGEPFLREDLTEIVKIFKKDFNVRIQTNSLLASEEKIKELAKAGLDGVSISLDTLNPQKQEFICNQKDVWYKIIKKIILFSQILSKKGSILLVNTVVSKQNIHELPKLTDFVNRLGVCASFVPVLLSDKKNHDSPFRDYAPELAFDKQDHPLIEKIYEKLIEMKKDGYYISNSDSSLRESATFLKENYLWKCDAGKLYFHIDPDGSFIPCAELPQMGFIFDKDFKEKFYSKQFQNSISEKIKSCPSCMHPCYKENSGLVNNPIEFLEKFRLWLNLALKKRSFLEYEEAVKYADFGV